MSKSILQDWVSALGLRHQGVLLTAVRGCDTAPKGDVSKALTRAYRAFVLNAHCGDASNAQTFIESCTEIKLHERMTNFRKNLDHYPHHYVMHVVHAAGIVGANYPHQAWSQLWWDFYARLCDGLHMNPETIEQMNARLNTDEHSFGAKNRE